MDPLHTGLANATRDASALQVVYKALEDRLPLTITVAVLVLTLVAITVFFSPTLDSLEPPAVRPRVPVIGHLLGIIQHQSDYHQIVAKRNPTKQCVTLPILNGKIYCIYDPHLIQQVIRARSASFEVLHTDFAQKVFGLPQATFDKLKIPGLIPDFTDAIHQSFQKESLHRMNMHWLDEFKLKIDPMSSKTALADPENLGREKILAVGIEVENFYLWCRDVMTLATCKALYGTHDPFSKDKSLLDAIWLFEEGVPFFLLSLAPSITMPRAYNARKQIQDALTKYFTAEHDITDPTASTLVHNRAGALRKYGWRPEEVALPEAILPPVSTLNAVPTFFWLLLYILQTPALVERIRKETLAHVKISEADSYGTKAVTMDIAKFEDELPLLVSCYRETMRLINHSVANRRMIDDLTITAQDGRKYLLKKGVDVQLPAGVVHRQTEVWGSDAEKFDPDRFMPITTKMSDADRLRKTAYMPFGGGRHLCPGRNFAFAEIISFTAVMILGFELEPTGMKFEDLKMRGPVLASGSVKPVGEGKGLGATITPREEFLNVKWEFR